MKRTRSVSGNPGIATPARLCVISFERLALLIESVAPAYAGEAEIVVERRRFGDAVAQAQALIDRGAVDAFISAGANGAQLRQQLDYPVILVKVSGFDIMAALVKAARTSRHVGVVTYNFISDELKEFSRFMTVPVSLRRYVGERDVAEQVAALRELGVDTVIGPSLVVETAEQQGLHGVLIYSEDSARQAVEDAIAAVRVAQATQARRRQLAALLGTLREGVLAVDRGGHVWLANPAIGELLGQPLGALQGRALSELLPGAEVASVMEAPAGTVHRQVFFVGERRMAGSLVALDEAGVRNGAVLSLQDATTVERAGRELRMHARRGNVRARHTLADIAGHSPAIESLRKLAGRFAGIDLSVLISGESGTGKELVAQGMHAASARSGEPFVAINCAALPESLLESELFGYEDGAFTGAAKGGRAGLFELAHRGTIFLDEIGDMPVALQARLLRVLQEREVWRVGGREPTPVDVRVVAATHRDLQACVRAGHFRQDLFYRLNGLCLRIPPLRERLADLPGLAQVMLVSISQRLGLPLPETSVLAHFLALAARYRWPGNVRELENLLERLVALSAMPDQGDEVFAEIFPELLAGTTEADDPLSLRERREHAELAAMRAALDAAGGKLGAAAQVLGVSRTTLWRRLRREG